MERNPTFAVVAEAALVFLVSVPLGLRGADALPTLDQVMELHLKALGGRVALQKSSTLVLSGECESTAQGESGAIEILIKTPRVSFDLGSSTLRMGFNGDVVWRHTATDGLQQHPGRQFAKIVTVFDPARVLWWKEWYPEMAVKGIERVGDREAYVLETHPGNPASERLFIDRQSGLLVRDEVMPKVVFTFSDYRAVVGVQVAFTIRQETPAATLTYTYHFKDAKRVTTVGDSAFQPR